MKEQTQLTAEEFLDKDEFVNVKGFINESGTLKTTTSLMEQYANAKVLEALEREKKLIKEKIIEAKQTTLESIHSDLTYKREYFADKDEWNQSDRFIQGRIRSLENAKQIVRNYYTKGTTKQK